LPPSISVSPGDQAGQFGQRRLGDLAGRQHDPDGARCGELGDHVPQVGGDDCPVLGECDTGLWVTVIDHAIMPGLHQPAHDVRTHPAEADHS
jgi:hypothetical protein